MNLVTVIKQMVKMEQVAVTVEVMSVVMQVAEVWWW